MKYLLVGIVAIATWQANICALAQNVENGGLDSFLLTTHLHWLPTIGKPIEEHEFDTLAQWVLESFRSNSDSVNVLAYIELVKVGNTVEYYQISNYKDLYMRIAILYNEKYDEAVRVLEADIGRGLGHYSCKYDLYISGKINDDSQYAVYRKL